MIINQDRDGFWGFYCTWKHYVSLPFCSRTDGRNWTGKEGDFKHVKYIYS